MKKLSIDSFNTNKIGETKQLNQILGGKTYKQTGSGTTKDGTYRDFSGDGGGSDQCGVKDGSMPG